MFEEWEGLLEGPDGEAIRGTLEMVRDITDGFQHVEVVGPESTPGGPMLSIRCTLQDRAEAWIIPSAWEINTGIGHAWIEAFMRGEGPGREKSIGLIRSLLACMFAGRFEETQRWDRKGRLVASTGRFYEPDGKTVFKTYDSKGAGIFTPRRKRSVVRYLPYE
ncbi:MAG: hypothetical protein WD004_04150 [Actinomycetota bacterium]